jgi:hypothetical protein
MTVRHINVVHKRIHLKRATFEIDIYFDEIVKFFANFVNKDVENKKNFYYRRKWLIYNCRTKMYFVGLKMLD